MKYLALFALPLGLALVPTAPAADKAQAKQEATARMIARNTQYRRAPAQQAAPQQQQAQQRNLSSGTRQGRNRQGGGQGRDRSSINPNVVRRSQVPTVENQARIYTANTAPVVVPSSAGNAVDLSEARRNRNELARRGRAGGEGNWRNQGGNDSSENGNWRRDDNDGARRNWRNRDRDGDGDNDNNRRWKNGNNSYRRQDWDRTRRDRNYWRSRYNRFALFGGGYYYWNSGYWYPAYGYDPYLSTYSYDAPIYSYNDQDPGETISNVQQELQQRGYYRGTVDGSFGRMTRQALLDFQRDSDLPVSGEIDQDTLAALGFE